MIGGTGEEGDSYGNSEFFFLFFFFSNTSLEFFLDF